MFVKVLININVRI